MDRWTVAQGKVKPPPPAALTLTNLWGEKGVNDDLLKRIRMHLNSSSIYYRDLHVMCILRDMVVL